MAIGIDLVPSQRGFDPVTASYPSDQICQPDDELDLPRLLPLRVSG
jgi:hypothetical protein